ncbi:MAG: guanylate kinase [Gammaproteobacteria bacterium]|nr:guanylate kinase [Gammaproteobacteria bacterium]
MPAGQLIIISAPSGAGKTSLVNALIGNMEAIRVSVSHTTRAPRPGETDGVDYNFVDTATFKSMIDRHLFLEYALVFDNYYGTSREWLKEQLDTDTDVVLEIDWQGAAQVRVATPGTISIFILPPSIDELRSRLESRGLDSPEVIERRLAEAREEISHVGEYDYVVMNDEFDRALADLTAIVRCNRLRTGANTAALKRRYAAALAPRSTV